MIAIFTDGGSRGNPGQAGIGVYAVDENGKVLYAYGKAIGIATNNVAEYSAVLQALDWLIGYLKEHPAEQVNFFLDSLLLVSQINGVYKVKNEALQKLLWLVREKEAQIKAMLRYSHIPREKNKEADRLVNEALDKLAHLPLQ